jgi:hypothetical protein
MIYQGKQMVAFSGNYIKHMKEVSKWLLNRSAYLETRKGYFNGLKRTEDLVNAFNGCAKNMASDTKKWQCLDYGYKVTFYKAVNTVLGRSRQCLLDTDQEKFAELNDTTNLYPNKFTHVHRVNFDSYCKYLDQLKSIVVNINAKNVENCRARH